MLSNRLLRTRLIDRRLRLDGRRVRFTAFLDEESASFEGELARALSSSSPALDLPLPQRHLWLKDTSREFRLLQVRGQSGQAALQIVVYVERPQRLSFFGFGSTFKQGPALSAEDESAGLRILHRLCCEDGDLLSLRLQPLRTHPHQLLDFEARARRARFHLCDPIGVTRTLLFDLRPSIEEILVRLTKKTRAKVRHRTREQVDLRPLTDRKWISTCRDAANASRSRTGGSHTRFDFEAAFALAEAAPDRVRVVGLFCKGRPDELLAYVVGLRHGELAEYASAGSFLDPELRSMPFNYFLVWDLVLWAKQGGASWLDLGGITDGGDGDQRAGITQFKRHLSDYDAELGRELLSVLRPGQCFAFDMLNGLRLRAFDPAHRLVRFRTGT